MFRSSARKHDSPTSSEKPHGGRVVHTQLQRDAGDEHLRATGSSEALPPGEEDREGADKEVERDGDASLWAPVEADSLPIMMDDSDEGDDEASRSIQATDHGTPPQPTTAAKLCDRCDVLMSIHMSPNKANWDIAYTVEDTFPELPTLTASAASGCLFCGFLKSAVLEQCYGVNAAKIDIRGAQYDQQLSEWSFGYHLDGLDDDNIEQIHIYLAANPEDPVAQWLSIDSAPLIPEPLSESRLRRIVEMIDKCDLVTAPVTARLPTRLIDVGSDILGCHPRLVVSQDDVPSSPSLPRYAALSYCWGPPEDSQQQRKTTSSSITAHRLGIDLNTLPATVRDAIILCRHLDIQYIWIDALCIIQDSVTDWELEAAQMASVYSGAYVTIAIASAPSCKSGFLTKSPCLQMHGVPVPFPSANSTVSLIWYKCHHTGDTRASWNENFSSPWNQRGWTLQEALMSQRLLVFGVNMAHIFYDNLMKYQSENGSRWAVWHPANPWGLSNESSKRTARGYVGEFIPSSSKQWHRSIEVYTSRLLSYPADRLPAVSSLAQSVAEMKTMGTYIAGLWSANLHYDLVWADNDVSPASTSRFNDVAPSWSWASHDGEVKWPRSKEDFQAELTYISHNIVVDGRNPYGRVKQGGSLTLSAKVWHVPSLADMLVKKDTLNSSFTQPASHLLTIEDWTLCLAFDRAWTDRADDSSHPLPVYLMLTCYAISTPTKGRPKPPKCLGLLLTHAEDGVENHFQRIGIFTPETIFEPKWERKQQKTKRFWDGQERTTVVLV